MVQTSVGQMSRSFQGRGSTKAFRVGKLSVYEMSRQRKWTTAVVVAAIIGLDVILKAVKGNARGNEAYSE